MTQRVVPGGTLSPATKRSCLVEILCPAFAAGVYDGLSLCIRVVKTRDLQPFVPCRKRMSVDNHACAFRDSDAVAIATPNHRFFLNPTLAIRLARIFDATAKLMRTNKLHQQVEHGNYIGHRGFPFGRVENCYSISLLTPRGCKKLHNARI